jgi:flavodoxin
MLDYANKLPNVQNKRAFIFSTAAIYNEKIMANNHKALRKLLEGKGFLIINEFGCNGFTARSIFNIIGGKNKNRQNDDDIKNAEKFAEELLK